MDNNHNSFVSMIRDMMSGAHVELPPPPERPITPRENRRLLLEHRQPLWIPLASDYNMIIPDVVLERPAHNRGGFDWFGVEWEYAESVHAPCPKPGSAIMDDLSQWRERVVFPDLDAVDWAGNAELLKGQVDPGKMTAVTIFNGVFERLHCLMGFEDAFVGMMTEPEAAKEYFMAMADFKIKLIDKLVSHYPIDVVIYHDDWGTNKSTFFSVEMFQELIYAPTKKICDYVHSRGLFFTLHCCGCVQTLVPYMVEMGVDAWEPAQMSINDLPAIKKRFGDKIVIETILDDPILMDRDAGEQEVRSKVRELAAPLAQGGGLAVTRINNGDPANIWWMCDEFYKLSDKLYGGNI